MTEEKKVSFESCAASIAATIRNYGEEDAQRVAASFERNGVGEADKLLARAREICKEQRK